MLGYDKKIVAEATEMAETFERENSWSSLLGGI